MIPQGLVLLTSSVLAIVTVRLARRKVLAQQLYCIETLARVDTLCVDKTGTVTENKMIVEDVCPLCDDRFTLEDIRMIMSDYVYAMQADNDTMAALRRYFTGEKSQDATATLPFSSAKKYGGVSFHAEETYLLGAPDVLLAGRENPYQEQIEGYSAKGCRVLLLGMYDGALSDETLSANLLPGDEMLAISGKPYDTLEEVIGLRESPCSLKEYGVSYAQVDLREDGSFDFPAIERALNDKTKLIHIQRSKGYCPRPTISVDAIGEAIAFCKKLRPDVVVMVDNCYGEFVEANEPSDFGADMIVGSLIKNPGGGLAPIGGYICGTQKCIDRCAYRLSAPGLGQEVGANLGLMPALYQGFFLAPSVVSGAVKGAVFVAACYEKLGFTVVPSSKEARHDIIQCVELGSPEGMVAFCKGIQSAAAVDSYVDPVPAPMPGYDSDVIMAAGAFVQGSSIELSADGPVREPYAVYYQGGLTWYHAKLGVLLSLQKMLDAGLITL